MLLLVVRRVDILLLDALKVLNAAVLMVHILRQLLPLVHLIVVHHLEALSFGKVGRYCCFIACSRNFYLINL